MVKGELEKNFTMSYWLVKRLQDIGRSQEKLEQVLNYRLFEKTSKHNPFWNDDDPEISDRLDEIRSELSCISDDLFYILTILRGNV